MRKGLFILISILIFTSCILDKDEDTLKENRKAKNIILMIGDGMGVTQIYAAMSVAEKPLNIEKFKHIGFHKTYSASNYTTDSGAGGTALATGVKTKNKHIGVDSSGVPLKSILHYAQNNMLATGLVSTSAITHATPASFVSHVNNRYEYEQIAMGFLDFDVDIFIGGGKAHFENRSDSLNLIDSLIKRDYMVLNDYSLIDSKTESKLAVFTADKHNPEFRENRGDMLPVSTEKAIDYLKKDKDGFFLMVEGSQIDWGGHDNDIEYITTELIDFDKAVGKALEFAKQDGETLLIVTADHETGGLSLTDGNISKKQIAAKFSTDHHTGVMVPVFAFGPGAEDFQGIYQNTDVFEKMLKAYGIVK